MRFVEKIGPETVTVGGRSGTPVLELANITQGNTIKVTVTFLAKTGSNPDSGFYYDVAASNPADAIALSSQDSLVQNSPGWSTTTKTVFYQAKISSQTGVEDIDFHVTFQKNDLDGQGTYKNFLITAQVVTLTEP